MSDRTWEDIAVEWMVACKAARERSATLESRLAEAEKALAEERGVSSTTIAGCIKFEEENRALSARVRELEGALKPWFESAKTTIATDPRDHSIDSGDAWVYGLVLGWGNALGEVALRHRWSAFDTKRLQDLHDRAARALKGEG